MMHRHMNVKFDQNFLWKSQGSQQEMKPGFLNCTVSFPGCPWRQENLPPYVWFQKIQFHWCFQ